VDSKKNEDKKKLKRRKKSVQGGVKKTNPGWAGPTNGITEKRGLTEGKNRFLTEKNDKTNG